MAVAVAGVRVVVMCAIVLENHSIGVVFGSCRVLDGFYFGHWLDI